MRVQISEETRQILERSYKPGNPFMIFELYAYALLTDSLSKEGSRVLGFMLRNMTYGNIIKVTQKEIAVGLNMLQQNVNRGVRDLITQSAIYEGKSIVGYECYVFNPNYGWYGSPDARLAFAQKLDHVNWSTKELPEELKPLSPVVIVDGMMVERATGEVIDKIN